MIKYLLPSFLILLTLNFNEVSLTFYGDNKADFTDTSLYINSYKIRLGNDEKIEFSISNESYFSPQNNSISTGDLKLFNVANESNETNVSLKVPAKINTYSSVSTSKDLSDLFNYAFTQFSSSNFFMSGKYYESFWREFIANRSPRANYGNEENPDSYDYTKDENGNSLDIRMLNIFHELMGKKAARDLIYESIITHYKDNASKLTKVQKQLILQQIDPLIRFCDSYVKNRPKYLKGRASVTEKPGEFNSSAEYGYIGQKEGFLFRRIEFDKVPPLELSAFLNRLKKEVSLSISNSVKFGDMKCEVNDGDIVVVSHFDLKSGLVFELSSRRTKSTIVVPWESFELTRISDGNENFYRVKNKQGKEYFTIDQDLNKL